jgi:DNA-binding NarL/FixJ family response regulator
MSLSSFRGDPRWAHIFNKTKAPKFYRMEGELNEVETRILQLVANGLKTHEIGEKLDIPPPTVETYRVRICRRLNVPNSCAAVAFGIRTKIIK